MTRGSGRLHPIGEHEASPDVNTRASYRVADPDRKAGP